MMKAFGLLIAGLLLGSCGGRAGPSSPGSAGLQVYWIDVEGGAATLVVTPAGESLLFDCGWPGTRDAQRIRDAAAKAGVNRIDHYFTTHWHEDHWGGVESLAKLMSIGTFYDHGFPAGEHGDITPKLKEAYLQTCQGKSVILKPGETIPLRSTTGAAPLKLEVLASHGRVLGEAAGSPQIRPCEKHPAQPEDTSDNARSLAFRLSFGDFRFIDFGDLTWNLEHKLVCPKNLIGSVDVYQVTHHGWDASNNPALLQAISPTAAVIDNGPKKGGVAKVFAFLKATPSIRDVYQLHRNVETGPADNAPAPFVANDDEACKGAWIRMSVEPDGKHYTIEIPAKGTRRTYSTKS
jgi:beta-lactamase superfamily II metal-dependent hydrolase